MGFQWIFLFSTGISISPTVTELVQDTVFFIKIVCLSRLSNITCPDDTALKSSGVCPFSDLDPCPVKFLTTIMDINYETNSSFSIFSPVEHPFPPFPPQSMLKTPRTFLDASPTLNKGGKGIFNSKILGF